jgi:hypothetical protein
MAKTFSLVACELRSFELRFNIIETAACEIPTLSEMIFNVGAIVLSHRSLFLWKKYH